ncbi:protein phosphatase 1 regulatory subunit 3A isoform X4 [Pungitius pungitius]|uniref:protein phosphatase 1 regulatory subunit 3A isoform X4 n=1 Tax=Pungitius pungitius TaxID=134920 RepID=UPI002E13C62A
MDVLHIPPSEEEEEAMEVESEGNGEQGEGGKEASSPMGSSTDEETDEDSEPEPPQVTRRKVSFADAFGLNLVSVKEFDNPEVAVELEVNRPTKNEATRPPVEFYVSCLFAVPSTPEELDQRLQEQMVELESIELLPGTTTLRGTVRVVNLCYHKSVYARMSLDRWTSYFDLSAEYVPGSSDWKTDRFTFRHTLVPPFEREGTRVELCLRYETSVGTFWANCKEMNYVLYCHQKRHVKEHEVQVQEESIGCQGKRSCLKANRRGCAEEKTRKSSKRSTDATLTAEEADRGSSSDVQPSLCWEGHKPLVKKQSVNVSVPEVLCFGVEGRRCVRPFAGGLSERPGEMNVKQWSPCQRSISGVHSWWCLPCTLTMRIGYQECEVTFSADISMDVKPADDEPTPSLSS